jgi:H+/gluconate symporter-like permease
MLGLLKKKKKQEEEAVEAVEQELEVKKERRKKRLEEKGVNWVPIVLLFLVMILGMVFWLYGKYSQGGGINFGGVTGGNNSGDTIIIEGN